LSLPLEQALAVAQRHLELLQAALADLPLPLTVAALAATDTQALRTLDQAVLRYLKLQDVMGQHVLPSFAVQVMAEPVEGAPFIDLLQRLEKRGILVATQWLATRDLRNQLTHDYPEDAQRRVDILNKLPVQTRSIASVLRRLALGL
jgi:hypothetical protein